MGPLQAGDKFRMRSNLKYCIRMYNDEIEAK